MEIAVVKVGDVVVITLLCRQLVAGNCGLFKIQLAPILEENTRIVLDFSNVQFVDSTGCSVIMTCVKLVTPRQGEVHLCHVLPAVQNFFHLVKLDSLCANFDSREDAIAAFSEPRKPSRFTSAEIEKEWKDLPEQCCDQGEDIEL